MAAAATVTTLRETMLPDRPFISHAAKAFSARTAPWKTWRLQVAARASRQAGSAGCPTTSTSRQGGHAAEAACREWNTSAGRPYWWSCERSCSATIRPSCRDLGPHPPPLAGRHAAGAAGRGNRRGGGHDGDVACGIFESGVARAAARPENANPHDSLRESPRLTSTEANHITSPR